MGDAGTIAVSNALSECKVSKLQELDLSGNGIGPPGGEALGNMLLVHTSLTDLNLSSNNLTGGMYAKESELPGSNFKSGDKVIYEGQELTVLAPTDSDSEVLLGSVEGIIAIADALGVKTSLTALDLRYNELGNESKAPLQQAVQGRSGFDLKM